MMAVVLLTGCGASNIWQDVQNGDTAAVQSQIDAKMADPDFSKRLMDGDKSAVEEINILFKRLEAAGYDPTPGL